MALLKTAAAVRSATLNRMALWRIQAEARSAMPKALKKNGQLCFSSFLIFKLLWKRAHLHVTADGHTVGYPDEGVI